MGWMESILLIFSTIGIFDALYISFHATTGDPVKCWIFPKKWCNKIQYSKFNKTIGIPNGYLGFVLYAGILILTLFHMYTPFPFFPLAALVTVGFLFAVYFTIIQAFVLRAFCVYCIVSAVNLTLMFLAILLS